MHADFRWIGKSEDGETVTLRKFAGKFEVASYATPEWLAANADKVRIGVVIDTETTGLNRKSDKVIEIGLRQFRFNRASGELLAVGAAYSALQDPGTPLSDDIKRLTGLTDAELQGKSIDWAAVGRALSEASIIIAHNASFDRPFVDRGCEISATKIWGCSLKQVEWSRKGYNVAKLEVLSIYHGFFADSHRALSDVDALLNLITMVDWTSRKPYLAELLANARRPLARIAATRAPFEAKDILKERGYNWDANAKCWHKTLFQEDLAAEVAWNEAAVYKGAFGGRTEEIAVADNFKS